MDDRTDRLVIAKLAFYGNQDEWRSWEAQTGKEKMLRGNVPVQPWVAVVDALEANTAERVRLAQEQAWNEGWARAMVRIEVDGEVQPESNPYTQGDKQA